jgi:Domain of unknown function (DUF4175)
MVVEPGSGYQCQAVWLAPRVNPDPSQMAAELDLLRSLLVGLRDRERRLLLLRAAAQGLGALLASALLAAILVALDAPTDLSRGAFLVALVAGVAVGTLQPLLRGWGPTRDLRRQARLVEAQDPELRHRLVTAVDRALLGEPGNASQALLARAIRGAAARAPAVPAEQVHPTRPARRSWVGAGALLVLFLAGTLLLPVGPLDATLRLLAGGPAEASVDTDALESLGDRAVVGDITLRYVYPDYTGLEPLVVPNSDGTIHAAPGSTVIISARTADVFDTVALQIDDEPPQPAQLVDGRDVQATLVVRGAGIWRLVLQGPQGAMLSRDFRIVAENDAAPLVTTDGQAEERRPVDEPLAISWQVRDDFGIQRVVLEVEVDGKVTEHELRAPLDVPLDLQGRLMMSARDLGLSAGATATLRVTAWDNDQLQGSKRGASAEIKLVVAGARSNAARLARYHQQLRDMMIPVLADFLEEQAPPSTQEAQVTAWVGRARERLTPIRELRDQQWGQEPPEGIDVLLIDRVLEDGARLFRFALTTFEAGSNRRITDGDIKTFQELHSAEVVSLELAIFVIDSMLRKNALAEVTELAKSLAAQAAQLSEASKDTSAAEMLARLDQLERALDGFAKAAAALQEGNLRDFLNGRVSENRNLVEQIRKAVAEGRMEDASELLAQLAEQVAQMAEGLEERMAAGEQGEDQLGERLKKAMEDLAQLEADQRALADKLGAAREKQGGGLDEAMKLWEQLDRLASAADGQSAAAMREMGDGKGWRVNSLKSVGSLEDAVDGVADGVRGRDVAGARTRVEDAIDQQRMTGRIAQAESGRARGPSEPVPGGLGEVLDALDGVGENLGQMRDVLEKLDRLQAKESPALQRLAQQLSTEQEELRQRGESLGTEVDTLERNMPTGDGSASKAMQQAGGAMERAEQSMQYGEALEGEGHQRDAAGRVQAAREALQRQQEEASAMQQAMQQMRENEGQGGQPDKPNGQQGASTRSEVVIPAPEAFQTPEAYRRALLEGMEGDVPDEFQALKRRYYQELVNQ